jgi:hypothetical protein
VLATKLDTYDLNCITVHNELRSFNILLINWLYERLLFKDIEYIVNLNHNIIAVLGSHGNAHEYYTVILG